MRKSVLIDSSMKAKGAKTILAGALAAASTLLGTVDKTQAQGTFNLTEQTTSIYHQQATLDGYTIPADASIVFTLTGVDISKANAYRTSPEDAWMGSGYATIQTINGFVNTPAQQFLLWTVNGPNAQVQIEGNGASPFALYLVASDAGLPSNFAFNGVSDYVQFFDHFNTHASSTPGLENASNSILGFPGNFQITVVPEPPALGLLAVGGASALALGRRRRLPKAASVKQQAATPSF